MSENQSLLDQLQQLLGWKKSKKFYAERLGITELEIDNLLKELRQIEKEDEVAEVGNYIAALEEHLIKVNNEKGTMESTIDSTFEPKNDEELAELHKIDLTKYKISNYWSKLKSNGKFTSSVFATLKKPKDYTPEDFAKFLETYTTPHVTREIKPINFPISVDVEISIADFHLAKKELSGTNNIKDRKKTYLSILKGLLDKVTNSYCIDRVVFPISNDFFHTDNYQNQTTNGTPQDVITDYSNEYEEGFDLLVQAINMIKDRAQEVHVILVQGNHDRTKSFYLAHALDVYFKNDEDIHFIRDHSTTKAVLLGNTFIGYHHGNCKIEDLPLLFATSNYSQAFGNALYREVHTGDKHHYMAKEVKGVRIQQMPSLSGTDRWHEDNNFVHSIRAALALVYDPEYGKVAEFEERIKI